MILLPSSFCVFCPKAFLFSETKNPIAMFWNNGQDFPTITKKGQRKRSWINRRKIQKNEQGRRGRWGGLVILPCQSEPEHLPFWNLWVIPKPSATHHVPNADSSPENYDILNYELLRLLIPHIPRFKPIPHLSIMSSQLPLSNFILNGYPRIASSFGFLDSHCKRWGEGRTVRRELIFVYVESPEFRTWASNSKTSLPALSRKWHHHMKPTWRCHFWVCIPSNLALSVHRQFPPPPPVFLCHPTKWHWGTKASENPGFTSAVWMENCPCVLN